MQQHYAHGKEAVCKQLNQAKQPVLKEMGKEADLMLKTFAEIDKKVEEANQQPYAFIRTMVREDIEHYTQEVARNEKLLQHIKSKSQNCISELTLFLSRIGGLRSNSI